MPFPECTFLVGGQLYLEISQIAIGTYPGERMAQTACSSNAVAVPLSLALRTLSNYEAPSAFSSPTWRTTMRCVSVAKVLSFGSDPDVASFAKAAPSLAWIASMSCR